MNASGAARPSSLAGSTEAIDSASAGASTPIDRAQVSRPPSSRRSRFTPETLPDLREPAQAPYAPRVRFSGKRAVVSGAAHGIGRAVAERLAAEGAEVAGLDVEAGATFRVDVRDESAVASAFESFGAPLDVVVANAGIQLPGDA